MFGADEDVGLAIADLLVLQMRRTGDDEQLLAIDFGLWHLAGLQRILDGQGMEAKAVLQYAKLGLVRLEQADPGELAVLQFKARGRAEVDLSQPFTIPIDIGCNDAHPTSAAPFAHSQAPKRATHPTS